jgi:hypothetical protein
LDSIADAPRGGADRASVRVPTRQFRKTLGPMSGALYEKRLYPALD